ncbi:hypothetical protein [Paraburkholderia susongensis]|nr:hypothetical protein [Paraburkholderia susongensis]
MAVVVMVGGGGVVGVAVVVVVIVPFMPMSAASARVSSVPLPIHRPIVPAAAGQVRPMIVPMFPLVPLRLNLPASPVRTGSARFGAINFQTAGFRHSGFLVRFVV